MADVRAGRAFVELSLQDNLTKGMEAAAATLKGFGSRIAEVGAVMSGLGGAITAPFIAAAKSFADAGSRLYDLSQRTGLSVEALGALKYAADQSGTSLEAVEVAVKKMQVGMTKAADGSKEMQGALADIGLRVQDFAGMNPEQMFAKVAGAIAEVQDPARKAAAAVAFFGKSGTQLLPMLNDFAALSAEGKRLGAVMSTADAKAADALGDSFGALQAAAQGVANAVGAALAPSLTAMALQIADAVAGVKTWIENNREVIVEIVKLGGIVAAVGAGITAFGLAIYGVGVAIGIMTPLVSAAVAAFSGLMTIVGMILAPLTTLTAAAGAVTTGIAAMGASLAALATPAGIFAVAVAAVSAAIVALGAYFLATSNIWADVFAGFKSTFGELQGIAETAFGGILAAVKAGDLEAAANILWLALKAIFQAGADSLQSVFDEIRYAGRSLFLSLEAEGAGWIDTILSGMNLLAPGVKAAFEAMRGPARDFAKEQEVLFAQFHKVGPGGQKSDALQAAEQALEDATAEAKSVAEAAASLAANRAAGAGAPAAPGMGFNSNPAPQETPEAAASRKATEEARAGESFTAQAWDAMAEAQKRDDAEFLALLNDVASGLPNMLAGLPEEMQAAIQDQAATTAGAFNLAGGFGEGAISAQDRTAKATEETARNTKRLNDTLKNAIPAFT